MGLSVVLLSAGYGTRLHPLTLNRPKTLLPLGDGVVLDRIMEAVDELSDRRRCLLVTNHRFIDQFEQWQRERRAAVTVLDDGTVHPEGRLGAVRDLEIALTRGGLADGEEVLVMGTDNLFTWSMRRFTERARVHCPSSSIALTLAPSPEEAARAAVVSCGRDGRITRFVEKPSNPTTNRIALCVYYVVFPLILQQVRQFLASGGNADAPGYFIEWLSRYETVYGVPMRGRWIDIGTPEAYAAIAHGFPVRDAYASRGE